MTQEVKNTKKKTAKTKEVLGIQEPIRKSMYDVVMENFKIVQRNTYLHRIIYIGEHTFPVPEQMDKFFEFCIRQANRDFHDREINTGILIRYTRHFIHMVEGDEDCIFTHLKYLFQSKNLQYLKNMKFILQLNHVNSRLTDDWSTIYARPVKLLTIIESDSILEETSRQIFVCVEKIYSLIEIIKEDLRFRESESELGLTNELPLTSPSTIFPRDSSLTITISLLAFKKQIPEMERLEFIIKSRYPIDLKTYLDSYWIVPQRDIYKDRVWPISADFVPYDIFDSAYNINTEFPKSKVEEKILADEEDVLIDEEVEDRFENIPSIVTTDRSSEK